MAYINATIYKRFFNNIYSIVFFPSTKYDNNALGMLDGNIRTIKHHNIALDAFKKFFTEYEPTYRDCFGTKINRSFDNILFDMVDRFKKNIIKEYIYFFSTNDNIDEIHINKLRGSFCLHFTTAYKIVRDNIVSNYIEIYDICGHRDCRGKKIAEDSIKIEGRIEYKKPKSIIFNILKIFLEQKKYKYTLGVDIFNNPMYKYLCELYINLGFQNPQLSMDFQFSKPIIPMLKLTRLPVTKVTNLDESTVENLINNIKWYKEQFTDQIEHKYIIKIRISKELNDYVTTKLLPLKREACNSMVLKHIEKSHYMLGYVCDYEIFGPREDQENKYTCQWFDSPIKLHTHPTNAYRYFNVQRGYISDQDILSSLLQQIRYSSYNLLYVLWAEEGIYTWQFTYSNIMNRLYAIYIVISYEIYFTFIRKANVLTIYDYIDYMNTITIYDSINIIKNFFTDIYFNRNNAKTVYETMLKNKFSEIITYIINQNIKENIETTNIIDFIEKNIQENKINNLIGFLQVQLRENILNNNEPIFLAQFFDDFKSQNDIEKIDFYYFNIPETYKLEDIHININMFNVDIEKLNNQQQKDIIHPKKRYTNNKNILLDWKERKLNTCESYSNKDTVTHGIIF